MSCAVVIPSPLGMTPVDGASILLLFDGIRQLGVALTQLKELRDVHGDTCRVDHVMKNEQGDLIGLRKNQVGGYDFVSFEPEKPSVKESINRVNQAYARIRVLDQVKKKGYQQVKEEKLPDGSIRLVVQKWR